MNELITSPVYHRFLPGGSREQQAILIPALYARQREKICIKFLPMRPNCGDVPRREEWNCYRSVLSVGWTDFQQLLSPAFEQVFPVADPTTGEMQEDFDPCFDNRIGRADWARWLALLRAGLAGRTAEEWRFLAQVIGWVETTLTHADVIVVEGNL